MSDILDELRAWGAVELPVEVPDRPGLKEVFADAAAEIERLRALLNEAAQIADNARFAMSPGPLYAAGFRAARMHIAERIRSLNQQLGQQESK